MVRYDLLGLLKHTEMGGGAFSLTSCAPNMFFFVFVCFFVSYIFFCFSFFFLAYYVSLSSIAVCGYLSLSLFWFSFLFTLSSHLDSCLPSAQVCTTSYHSAELEWLQCQGELDATHWWHQRTDWQVWVEGLQQRPPRSTPCQSHIPG